MPSLEKATPPQGGAGRRPGTCGKVRIIAGKWRHRHLAFPPIPGLRPTPDRVRETLFNWLQPYLPGSHCLDLFSGSGALGFEAVSRGAVRAVLVDRDKSVAQQLRQQVATFCASEVQVVQGEALAWLQGPPEPFHIAFLDPPFGCHLLEAACQVLEGGGWLREGAWIYLESESHGPMPAMPASWKVERSSSAGQVRYCLAQRG